MSCQMTYDLELAVGNLAILGKSQNLMGTHSIVQSLKKVFGTSTQELHKS